MIASSCHNCIRSLTYLLACEAVLTTLAINPATLLAVGRSDSRHLQNTSLDTGSPLNLLKKTPSRSGERSPASANPFATNHLPPLK
jgi:hypothetical protein